MDVQGYHEHVKGIIYGVSESETGDAENLPWDQLERALLEDDGDEDRISLELQILSEERAAEFISQILKGKILSQLLALKKIEVHVFLQNTGCAYLSSRHISAAPTRFDTEDFSITLDSAQRAEWLLRGWGWLEVRKPPTTEDIESARKEYLQSLLEAARAKVQEGGRDQVEMGKEVAEEALEGRADGKAKQKLEDGDKGAGGVGSESEADEDTTSDERARSDTGKAEKGDIEDSAASVAVGEQEA